MVRQLDRWLWKGSFEPSAHKVDVAWEPDGEAVDFATTYSNSVAKLQSQMESLLAAAERKTEAESQGQPVLASAIEKEIRSLARSMLPGMDAIDRLVEAGELSGRQDEFFNNWLISIKALKVRFLKILEEIGVTAISAVGSEVNLEIHDVVSVVPAGEYPPDVVVKEQQTGYYFRGKLLRDAKVIVAQ